MYDIALLNGCCFSKLYGNHLREFVLTHVILTTGACGREALSST